MRHASSQRFGRLYVNPANMQGEYLRRAQSPSVNVVFIPFLVLGAAAHGMGIIGKFLIVFCLILACTGSSQRGLGIARLGVERAIVICAIIVLFYIPMAFFAEYNSVRGFFTDAQFFVYAGLALFAVAQMPAVPDFESELFEKFLFWLRLALLVHFGFSVIAFLETGRLFVDDYGEGTRIRTALGPATSAIFYLSIFIPHYAKLVFVGPLKISETALLICLGGLILLTGGRTAMFALAIIIFVGATLSGRLSLLAKGFVIIVLCCSAALFVTANIDRFFFDGVRTFDSINDSGRQRIWETLLEQLEGSWLLGYGHGAVNAFLVHVDSVDWGYGEDQAHNDYIRIIFNLGATGALATIFLFWNLFAASVVKVAKSRGVVSGFDGVVVFYALGLLVLMATDNVFIYHFYIYPVIVAAAFAKRERVFTRVG
jgi:hypothetical protein